MKMCVTILHIVAELINIRLTHKEGILKEVKNPLNQEFQMLACIHYTVNFYITTNVFINILFMSKLP